MQLTGHYAIFLGFSFLHIEKKFDTYPFFHPHISLLCQISYPFFTGTLIENLNFLSGKRLDLFFGGKPIHLGIFAGFSTFTGLYIFLRSDNRYIKITYFILALTSF